MQTSVPVEIATPPALVAGGSSPPPAPPDDMGDLLLPKGLPGFPGPARYRLRREARTPMPTLMVLAEVEPGGPSFLVMPLPRASDSYAGNHH